MANSEDSTTPLLVEQTGAVVTLINNDAPRNRMGLDYMDALEKEVARVAADPSIRAVVITAAGEEHFSVGMNLKQLPEGIQRMGSAEAVFDQSLTQPVKADAGVENAPLAVVS